MASPQQPPTSATTDEARTPTAANATLTAAKSMRKNKNTYREKTDDMPLDNDYDIPNFQSNTLTGERSLRVLFVSGVGPDNYVVAVLFARQQQSLGLVAHIVLVGRPVDFRLARFEQSYEVPTDMGVHAQQEEIFWPRSVKVIEQDYEKDFHNPVHAQALLACTAFHMHQVLETSGLDMSLVRLYDGGVAQKAGLSHIVHNMEDQYFDDDGTVRTVDEYLEKEAKIYNMLPHDRVIFRLESCVRKFKSLLPLSTLKKELMQAPALKFLVGAAMTPLKTIAEMDETIRKKPGIIRAMSCAWGMNTLLKDNFNNQVDWPAFAAVCLHNAFPRCVKVFITSEACKNNDWLTLTPAQLRDLNMHKCADLVSLFQRNNSKIEALSNLSVILPSSNVPGALSPVALLPGKAQTVSQYRCNLKKLDGGSSMCYAFGDAI